jgi:hypothetical protein
MSVNIKTNVNVKKKIVVNGHEYGGAEELPEDLRKAYDQAMSAASASSKVKIVLNGKEYGSVGEMSSDVRRIYEGAMAAVKTELPFHKWKAREEGFAPPAGGWEKGFSFSERAAGKVSVSRSWVRWLILGFGILLLLIGVYSQT